MRNPKFGVDFATFQEVERVDLVINHLPAVLQMFRMPIDIEFDAFTAAFHPMYFPRRSRVRRLLYTRCVLLRYCWLLDEVFNVSYNIRVQLLPHSHLIRSQVCQGKLALQKIPNVKMNCDGLNKNPW